MIGGNGKDTLYVSAASYDSVTGTGRASTSNNSTTSGDVLVGGGGNDWVIFTGSDVYWSGVPGANTAELTFALSNNGDSKKGQSISNVKLQDGDPVALNATGNATSEGNQHNSDLGAESGSNEIVGNEFDNILDGGGVGGTSGKGVGVDTLTGGGGSDRFEIGNQYRISSEDKPPIESGVNVPNTNPLAQGYKLRSNATDGSYATITDFSYAEDDTLYLQGSLKDYLIGGAPNGFNTKNIAGGFNDSNPTFGIYYRTNDPGVTSPNLVAVINGESAGITDPNSYAQVNFGTKANPQNVSIDGVNSTDKDPNHLGGQYDYINGESFLGFGPMYELSNSAFANHVNFA